MIKLLNIMVVVAIVTTVYNAGSYSLNAVDNACSHIAVESVDTLDQYYSCIDKPSVQNMLGYLKHIEMRHPELVLRQAILESGWFRSKYCIKYNNMFGMGKPYYRQSAASSFIKTDKSHYIAQYDHWTICADDYKLYQDYMFNEHDYSGRTDNDYIQFLIDRHYFEEDPTTYKSILNGIRLDK